MSGKNVEVSVYTEYPNIGILPTVALRAKQTHVKVNSGGMLVLNHSRGANDSSFLYLT